MHYSSEMDEVLADDNGEVKAIKTKAGDVIECELVGLTVGVRPNVDFLKESELDIDRGILVNEYLETNQQDVYAIGDCAQHKKPSVNRRPL
jgi:3-phenylpropionate/trans-cinnamate dioxygenase ferredoxin reductase subunit